MPVVICCDGSREWYRDVFVAQGELYCSPRSPNDPPRTMARPTGTYDLAAYIKTLPAPWNEPSLLVVCDDTGGNSVARNLAGVHCPKALVVGDTHHICAPGKGPLARPIAYAREERYDLVIGEFNRHHLHFFKEAGLPAAWLPSFTLRSFERAADGVKRRQVTFVGQAQARHPYRNHVLESLPALGVAVEMLSAPQTQTAVIQSESRINLNVSLNGDLNLRNFEVPAAGGFLMTDRLSEESGQSLLFEDRRQMVMYDSPQQLVELTRYFLAQPQEAAEIAVAGHAEYLRLHRPAEKARQLREMLGGKTPEAFDLRLDRRTFLPAQEGERLWRRVALYEFLQELHRVNLRLEVLFWAGAERQATDAMDLPRMKISVLLGNQGGGAPLVTARMDGRVHWVTVGDLQQRGWPIVVCTAAAMNDGFFQQCLQTRRWEVMVIADYDAARDDAALRAVEQRLGWKRLSNDPPAFAMLAASR